MQTISSFEIATSSPVGREAIFAQTAEAYGMSEPEVRQFLRHTITLLVPHGPRKGIVAYTAAFG